MKLSLALLLTLSACASPSIAPTSSDWGRISAGTGRVVTGAGR